jgi:hypothetical protein
MVLDRIKSFRERLQRREKQTRASRRASARRVDKGEPETTTEKIKVGADEAQGLAKDATRLVSTELGVDPQEAKQIIATGSDTVEETENKGLLDFDNDGDTDLFTLGEGGFGSEQDQRSGEGTFGREGGIEGQGTLGMEREGDRGFPDPTEPVFDPFNE